MVKTIRFYSILSTFILASCHSNKPTIDGVDWTAPNNLPVYVDRHEHNFQIWLKTQKDIAEIVSFKKELSCPDQAHHLFQK